MVQVKFQWKGRMLCVDFKGHANYSDTGNDIVCASVSCLAYTLLGALTEEGIKYRYHDRQGDFELVADVPIGKLMAAHVISKVVLVGLLQIQKKYSENLSVFFDDF